MTLSGPPSKAPCAPPPRSVRWHAVDELLPSTDTAMPAGHAVQAYARPGTLLYVLNGHAAHRIAPPRARACACRFHIAMMW